MDSRKVVQQSFGLPLVVRYLFISTSLVAIAWGLLRPSLDGVNAGPPDPTPGPASDIMTKLQPYQTPGVEPSQSNGYLVHETSLPSDSERRPTSPQDQQMLYSIADACVIQVAPSSNFGSATDMWVGYDHCIPAEISRSLVQFDVSSIPAGASISTATLSLRLVNSCDMGERTHVVAAYRTTASWSESSVTWDTQPGYAEQYGSASIPSLTWEWYEFDVTDLARGWVDGSLTNYGLMVRGPESSGNDSARLGFGTRESGLYTPTLVIEYTTTAAPRVDSITPDSGTNDGPVHITDLAGANFQTGAAVQLSKAGEADIDATNTVVVSDAQITCDFDLTGAATGAWDVVVTNSDSQSGTLPGGFTVNSLTPPPQVDSITPVSGTNDGLVHITDLAGANFQTGAIPKLIKAGEADIDATNTVVVSDTQITCDFDLTGAATGDWDVVVTNPDSQSGTLPGGFTVEPGRPLVYGITPDSGTNDGPVHITDLAGANFQTGAMAKLSKAGETDIDATNIVVVSDAQITCDFDLTSAVTGTWDVVVTNSDSQSGTLPGGFTVTSVTPPPQVDSITPDSGTNDGLVHITDLAGANFQTGAAVQLSRAGETDIDATSVVVVSDAQTTCDFDLTGAATGAWDVVVTNPDSQSGTLPAGFTVNYAPLQAGFTASPTTGVAPLTVSFTNTSTGDYTASLWAFGDGLTSILDSPTHLYETAGTYTVTLMVFGPGGSDTETKPEYITVSKSEWLVYLPLALRRWPPIPYTPVLNPISNPDGDGIYTVDWDSAELAESYTLEEATNASFTDATVVYQGTWTSHAVSGRSTGTYYYRVKATNGWGDSGWSNVRSAYVGPPDTPGLNDISNPDGDGSYTVSWTAANRAQTYTLQEDDNAAFSSPTAVYSGSDLSKPIAGKDRGTYYYRVRASNGAGNSGWSNTKSVVVTVSLPPCEQHDFGVPGTQYYIYTDGRSWNFTADGDMAVRTVQVKSVLATSSGRTFYIQVRINGNTVASWSQYVNSTTYEAFYHSADVAFDMHTGDTITYHIRVGSGVGGIAWMNYVKLCR
jgi:PKD repeat protein